MVDARVTDLNFAELVAREHRGAVAASALIVGTTAVAEEIVQDVFERAYQRWSKVSRLDRPGAWIRRAVINQSISVSRRQRSETKAVLRLGGRRLAGNSDPQVWGADPSLDVGDSVIWRAVKQLPEKQASALALHYGADLDLETVADEMGLTVGAVKSLLYRARAELRNHALVKEVVR